MVTYQLILSSDAFDIINDLKQFTVTTTRNVFYVCIVVDLMKTAKVNAYIMHIFGKIELFFYLYMQPKFISKCITLMTSKRQRHTYLSTLEIW